VIAMPGFSDRLVAANRPVWAAMAAHPFVLGLADGSLPDEALHAWIQQDRVFVLEERQVLAALRAHGLPEDLDRLLAGLDGSVLVEADAFAATATARGIPVEAEPWPVCLGYTSYLLRCARDGVLEGLTALYAAERAYLDTWTAVAAASPPGSPHRDWIDNWTSPAFRAFVADLGKGLDELAGTPSAAMAERLALVFANAARFELAFWEMCWARQGWPA
jgi:formylaminopyrimidine deformylase / aminopyrimidine aminohydrolase